MRRRRFSGAVGTAAIAIAILAMPGAASAKVHRKSPGESAEFTIPTSNGYLLNVKSEKGVVTVVASDAMLPFATISSAGTIRPANTGPVSTNSYILLKKQITEIGAIDADLGPFGTIDVTFQPSGQVRVTKPDLSNKTTGCVAASRIVRKLGKFTGMIQFEGEGGYTAVDASSAAGTVGTSPFRNCSTKAHSGGGSKSAPTPGVALSAFGSTGSGSMFHGMNFFAEVGGGCPKGSCFRGLLVEPVTEGLIVAHEATAVGPKSDFGFDAPSLDSATVKPPAPFSGSASFRRGGSPAWTGDLEVSFPGGVTAPLTGPGFIAHMLHFSG